MGKKRQPEPWEAVLPRGLSAEQRHARTLRRQAFRKMVQLEISDQQLTWLRRRALLRFARRLPLGDFEARLIIRAVEYESGHVAPAAMADIDPLVEHQYLSPDFPQGAWLENRLLLALVVLLTCALFCLLS